MVKAVAKAILRPLTTGYWNGWLYFIEPSRCSSGGEARTDVRCAVIDDVQQIAASRYPEIQMQALTPAPESWAFGAWIDHELAGVCWVQAGATHRARGGLMPLRDDEAEMAQMTIASAFRGRGLATILMCYSCQQMSSYGYRRLYGKIWHDNIASIRLVERTGWTLDRRFVSVQLRGRQKPILWKFS
jgi:ribosomal protein S18 acetylase RimI-like enzyme